MSRLCFMGIRGAPVLALASGAAALDGGGGMTIGISADGTMIDTDGGSSARGIISGMKRIKGRVDSIALAMARTMI